jgi:hypothetical protein
VGLGFGSLTRDRFDPAKVPLDRRIQSDGQQLAAGAGRPFGPRPAGRQRGRRHLSAAQGAGGQWAASSDRKLFFLSFNLQNTVLIVFVQFFEQVSYSFLYSSYSNENFV